MSVAAMQNIQGVSSVTRQDDEAAFGEMDVQGTGLVDMYELADGLRVMGKSERDIRQLIKELVHALIHICTTPTCLSSVRVLL